MPNLRALVVLTLVMPLASLAAPPAAGSPEEAVRESLILLRDGKADDWIRDWCAPERCPTDNATAMESLRRGALASALKAAPSCLHGDAADIQVTRVKGDPATDTKVTVFIQCEASRMPTPATAAKVDGKWRISSMSW